MSRRHCVRCASTTKTGARCRRNTCVYFQFCWQHTREKYGLYLKPSAIPHAGLGLFTLRDIQKGRRIAAYTGVLRTDEELDRMEANANAYAVRIKKNLSVDASSTQTALGRYANDCRSVNVRRKECPGTNAKFVVNQRTQKVYLKATKRIQAGSEIFLAYGRAYWNQR